jgi:uncharacterized protein YkwD
VETKTKMRNKLRAAVLLAVMTMTVCFPASAARETLTVEQVLMQANADRNRLGLPSLKLDHTLNLAAFAKAEDMLAKGYFAHHSPEGVMPWHWFKALGYNYSHAGENLAIGFDDASELERSWMASPKHKDNILSPQYTDMGVAIVYKNGQKMVVQLFGSRLNLTAIRE